jgi:CHAD domain-containing protein
MHLFSITNNEEISVAAHRVLTEQYNIIIDACSNHDTPHESIHDTRKSSKRIRAVLRLIKPDISAEIYNKEKKLLRELSGKFATARNIHVFAEEFDSIMKAGILELPATTENEIRSFFKEREEEALKLLLDLDMFKVVGKKNEEARDRLAAVDFSSLGPHTIYKGVSKVFAWGQKQMIHSQQFPTDDNLHEMRKRMKALMYLVKLVKDVSPVFFNGYYRGLKSASLALGEDHNMAEMLNYIDTISVEILPEVEREKIHKYITSQRQQIQVEVWPLIAKLYTGQADEFSKRIKAYWLLGRQA